MKILAIDPGYDRLGIAVLNHEKSLGLLYSECFIPEKGDFEARLLKIVKKIRDIIGTHTPSILGIETLFFTNNQKTALRVAETRGAIISEATQSGLAIHEFTPLEIKIAVTGYGRSDKKSVRAMVPRLVDCKKTIQFDDEYDAIATGITCAASLRTRQLRAAPPKV
ncbi:MAG: hypothetical protein A2928_04135 [Candidatus Taylorbacteria bacterium RIFCSPLOWO2_01_FULL_45_15b]|uniref:crossover junction endodeoxyribonuclease n=1 Tax=Candidatus Taylorbacteria bacterium RIFCSPLOWO2_01_FULL_45_15b TaxID=1802319 RepID=A0A1G2N8T7_9BACT|nr:MAG: hypothetical protein A2928_04135 [Candidatus Taylorbacteria bacterium RIFCSPLOWO2_01_FULL_45_15b]